MQGVKAKNPHKAIRGFAYLLALGLPFAQVTALSRGIGLLCSLVLVLWTLMLARQAGQKRKRTALTWISLALLAWWSLATAFSLRPLDSGFALLEWALPFFAFFLYLRQSALPQQALRNLLAISGIAYLTLLAYAFLLSAFPGKAAIRPFFQDANFFAAALSLLLPGLFGLGMARQQPQKQKIIALAAAALLLLALIALRSRGAWVGLGGSGMLLIFLLLRNWWQRSLFLGISLSLGLFAIGIMQPYLAKRPTLPAAMRYLLSTSDVQTDFSNRERLMRWRCAWRMFKENPVMGRGPATYAPDFKHYLQNWSEVEQISYWAGWQGGGHSTWLTALAETGLLGFLLLIAWVGAILLQLVMRIRAHTDNWMLRMAIFAIGTWLVHGIFNDLFMLAPIAAILGIWFGFGDNKD